MSMVPFLVNPPHSLVVYGNPRRKRKSHSRRKARKIKAASRRTGESTMRKRRRSRRNPIVLGANPRRRKRSHRRHSRRRRNPIVLGANPRRRSRRHNPLVSMKALQLPNMKEIAFLGVGAVVTGAVVPRVLPFLPKFAQNAIGRAAGRVAVVAALGFVANKVIKAQARMFVYGAVANQIVPVANDVLSLVGMRLGDIGLGQEDESVEMYYESAPAITHEPEMGIEMYYDENTVSVG